MCRLLVKKTLKHMSKIDKAIAVFLIFFAGWLAGMVQQAIAAGNLKI